LPVVTFNKIELRHIGIVRTWCSPARHGIPRSRAADLMGMGLPNEKSGVLEKNDKPSNRYPLAAGASLGGSVLDF
jgi:hypothetical protein